MDVLAALQFGFAPAIASALLHALWQVTLLGVIAWLTLASMSRSGAAARHAVGTGFLLAMVVVPALTFARFWQIAPLEVNAGLVQAVTAPRVEAAAGVFVQQSSPVAIALALMWLTGVGVMLLRHFGGWRLVSALDRHPSEVLPAPLQRRVEMLRTAMGITREVAVRVSADVVGPFTARLLRPVIWLPLSLVTQLPREQMEALLAHELAHVARMDWLWNGLQCVVESLLFFHPAAWWLGRRIRQEREHACDDLAVAACGDAIALAEALVQLERQRQPAPHPAHPRLVLAAHGGSLMQRISRLVSGPPSRGRWGARAGLVVLLGSAALLVSQVGISGNPRPNIHISTTTDGVMRPGDVREITANGLDKQRYYRGAVDAQGRLIEVYQEDGQARPIDVDVRSWLSEIARLSVPPAPPLPPMPPKPPAPPAPPVAFATNGTVAPAAPAAPPAPPAPLAPPAPPAPPEIADTAVFQSLLRVVANDPGVIAKLGTPIALASNDVHGRIEVSGGDAPDAEVDATFELTGPKGRRDVHVVAELDQQEWSVDTIEFRGR